MAPRLVAGAHRSGLSRLLAGGTRSRTRWLYALPLLLAGCGLAAAGDLGAAPLKTAGWLALAVLSALLLCAVFARAADATVREIVLLAALVRLPFLWLEPSLSEDVWRYLVEGHVVRAGENPYLLAPAAPRLGVLRSGVYDEIASRVGHAEIPSVYPPGAMAAFVVAAADQAPLWRYKLALFGIDLLGCAALAVLARRLRRPLWRTTLYALNPVVLLEGVGMGHVDALAVLPLVLALILVGERSAPRAAGAALAWAAAALVKPLPLVALPVLARRAHQPRRFVVVALILFAIGCAPMVVGAGGVPPALVRYAVSWEWNGPLFEPLWRLLQSLHVAPALKAALERVETSIGDDTALGAVFPYLYPQLLAKVLLLLALPLVFRWSLRAPNVDEGVRRAMAGSVCLMATVYPWYLFWVLPWAALERSLPWLVLSVTVLFSYLPRLAGVDVFPVVWALVWSPPVLVWWWQRRRRRRRRRRAPAAAA